MITLCFFFFLKSAGKAHLCSSVTAFLFRQLLEAFIVFRYYSSPKKIKFCPSHRMLVKKPTLCKKVFFCSVSDRLSQDNQLSGVNATSHLLFLPDELHRAAFLGFLEITSLCQWGCWHILTCGNPFFLMCPWIPSPGQAGLSYLNKGNKENQWLIFSGTEQFLSSP